jgi:hypothetical protein
MGTPIRVVKSSARMVMVTVKLLDVGFLVGAIVFGAMTLVLAVGACHAVREIAVDDPGPHGKRARASIIQRTPLRSWGLQATLKR